MSLIQRFGSVYLERKRLERQRKKREEEKRKEMDLEGKKIDEPALSVQSEHSERIKELEQTIKEKEDLLADANERIRRLEKESIKKRDFDLERKKERYEEIKAIVFDEENREDW